MRNGISHLYIPGPTNVPERVRRAMNVPMEDHRAPDYPELVLPLFDGLKRVFRMEAGRVFLYPGSGTGAWEAAITNTLNPGDKVLMSRYGQFSHLWAEMAERLGLDVICIDEEWGKGVPVEAYAKHLAEDITHSIRGVFVTHNETATGVASDIPAVRAAMDAADHPAMLYVDGVSSIGSLEFRMEEWGVDLCVSGSQKGFMLPAGLGILAVSDKALDTSQANKMKRAYFDFGDMAKMNDQGYFPYTPPTQLFYGLREALAMLEEEGLDAVVARHARLAEGVRRAVDAWAGCALCAQAPKWYSDTVSAIVVPEDVDANAVIRAGYDKYRTSFGGGLARLGGKVFRIGHIGDLNEVMCLSALASAEMALVDAGARIELGSGVAAAQAHYRSAATPALRIAAE